MNNTYLMKKLNALAWITHGCGHEITKFPSYQQIPRMVFILFQVSKSTDGIAPKSSRVLVAKKEKAQFSLSLLCAQVQIRQAMPFNLHTRALNGSGQNVGPWILVSRSVLLHSVGQVTNCCRLSRCFSIVLPLSLI